MKKQTIRELQEFAIRKMLDKDPLFNDAHLLPPTKTKKRRKI